MKFGSKVTGIYNFSVLLVIWALIIYKNGLPNNPPKHLGLEVDWQRMAKSEAVFLFKNPDTLLTHQMHLLRDQNDLPLLYYANIQTPVCIDGLCKPLHIEMYWDLVGQYVGYGVYPEEGLTKFDHEVFEPGDYLKLHQLLLNPHSILDRRKVSDLYDIGKERKKQITFKGKEVDGISGATKKEVKTTVVEGALYSCYTLWHLAYGNAAEKIKNHLPAIRSDSLANYFLQSGYEAYQMDALKQLSLTDFQEKIDLLIPILKNGKPLIRAYILKKLPKPLFGHPLFVAEVYQNFSDLDFNSRTLLINHLQYSKPDVAIALSKQLTIMSENQLNTFLKQLESHQKFQMESVMNNLRKYAEDKNFTYSYLVQQFLETTK